MTCGRSPHSERWLLPMISWMIILYLIPLLFIISTSFRTMVDFKLTEQFTLRNYAVMLREPLYWKAMRISLSLALKTVFITTLLAFPLALSLVYTISPKHRMFFLILIIAPFWTSYLIRAYSWYVILGNKGIVNIALLRLKLISQPIKILYTNLATTIGLVHYLLPIMTLNLYTTLENIPPRLLEAAHDLGASRLQIFSHIILPLSRTGLINGMMFIYILAFADFISPATLGGQAERVFPQLIVDAVQWNINWPMAASLSVMMVLSTFFVLAVFCRFRHLCIEREGSGK